MRVIGWFLIVLGVCVWQFGHTQAFWKRAGTRNRSGWALPERRAYGTLNSSGRKRFFGALIVAVVLASVGGWILRQ
jgi:hypothetical protein